MTLLTRYQRDRRQDPAQPSPQPSAEGASASDRRSSPVQQAPEPTRSTLLLNETARAPKVDPFDHDDDVFTPIDDLLDAPRANPSPSDRATPPPQRRSKPRNAAARRVRWPREWPSDRRAKRTDRSSPTGAIPSPPPPVDSFADLDRLARALDHTPTPWDAIMPPGGWDHAIRPAAASDAPRRAAPDDASALVGGARGRRSVSSTARSSSSPSRWRQMARHFAVRPARAVMAWPLRTKVFLALCVVLAPVLLGPLQLSPARATEISAPFEWYRYQGESDSGPAAAINCEVASNAMAIQLARGGLRVPIKDIRTIIGHNNPTGSADSKKALRYWGVQTNDIDTIEQVVAAVRRGNAVMVGLYLSAISPGEDLGLPRSAPNQRTGRYSTYTGAHSIVVKGVSADGQWLTVYDPNHWDGNPAYVYADGTPKGKNRLYRTSEVAKGMRELVDFPRAIEIVGAHTSSGGQAIPTALAAATGGDTVAAGRPAPRQISDLTALVSGGNWASAVVSFGVRNDGAAPVTFDAIGIRGVRPNGTPYELFQRNVTMRPGDERVISLILETPAAGEWRVTQIVYQAGGQFIELPNDNRVNRATFRIGAPTGMAPITPAPSGDGKKPSGPTVPGPTN
ncbi:MAG: hypothetical protein NZ518_01315 [Dehalococcoidia bacterium]|nr:hypothetical protein [Dehalococcoidia bacterium]